MFFLELLPQIETLQIGPDALSIQKYQQNTIFQRFGNLGSPKKTKKKQNKQHNFPPKVFELGASAERVLKYFFCFCRFFVLFCFSHFFGSSIWWPSRIFFFRRCRPIGSLQFVS